MNDGQLMTKWVVALTTAWLIAWDIYAAARWGRLATITAVVGDLAHEYPALVAALFFALGHIFWPPYSAR